MKPLPATLAAALLLLAQPFSSAAEPPKPLKVLLITGGCCHDYKTQKDVLKQGLEARLHATVDQVHSPDGNTTPKLPILGNPAYAKGYDVVIHDECAAGISDPAVIDAVLAPHRAGIPAVNLHCAMHSYRIGNPKDKAEAGSDRAKWFEYLGLQSSGHGPRKPLNISTVAPDHAALAGLSWSEWTTIDEELYNNIQVLPTAVPLQSATQKINDNKTDSGIVTWANDYKGARVFSTTVGHVNDTVADARYLELVARGLVWATGKSAETYLKPAPAK